MELPYQREHLSTQIVDDSYVTKKEMTISQSFYENIFICQKRLVVEIIENTNSKCQFRGRKLTAIRTVFLYFKNTAFNPHIAGKLQSAQRPLSCETSSSTRSFDINQ